MADLNQLTVQQIKDLLKDKGMPTTGNKGELLARLEEGASNPNVSTGTDDDTRQHIKIHSP